MRVVVAGASGATGRLVVDCALAAGHEVTALVRDLDAYAAPSGVEARQAQVVTDPDLDIPADADAVITTLGKHGFRDPQPVCESGTKNLLGAMKRSGVRRIVAVSAVPVLTSGPGEPWWFRFGVRPLVHRVGRDTYADLAAMEDLLHESGCDWTVVRPGYLTDKPPTNYRLLPEANATTSACRADLAHALVQLVDDASAIGRSYGLKLGPHERKVLA